MRRRRTTASRWAAVATGLLALVLLEQTLDPRSIAIVTLQGAVTVTAAAGAVMVWLRNSFESHLVVVVAVVACVVGSALGLTLGMPGGPVSPPSPSPSPSHVLILALSVTIVALLLADARARRAGS